MLGLFSIFWLDEPKCTETMRAMTETDHKCPTFVPFGANLPQFVDNDDIHRWSANGAPAGGKMTVMNQVTAL